MALFFNSVGCLMRRQIMLNCERLAVRWCSNALFRQNWRTLERNTVVWQNLDNSVRWFASSSPTDDTQPVADKTIHSDDDTSPTKILANLPAEEGKRFKVLKLEYDVFMSSGIRVPENVSDEEWLHVLRDCRSRHTRIKYFSYLFKREKQAAADSSKRAMNRLKREEKLREIEQRKKEGTYEFINSIHFFVRESTMNHWYENNLCYALMNGPNVVFDFSFEAQMTDFEIKHLVKQIQFSHGDNKVEREPFHFHFCNLAPNSKTDQRLQFAINNLYKIPYTVTDKHYLDCYDRSRLVYLSPNAPEVMTAFNYDDVYIIGCIVDKAVEEPLTFARAKQEKIRCVRLPLERHVRWVQGSKSLTVNQIVNILLTLKRTKDWEKALLKHLPARKYTMER